MYFNIFNKLLNVFPARIRKVSMKLKYNKFFAFQNTKKKHNFTLHGGSKKSIQLHGSQHIITLHSTFYLDIHSQSLNVLMKSPDFMAVNVHFYPLNVCSFFIFFSYCLQLKLWTLLYSCACTSIGLYHSWTML